MKISSFKYYFREAFISLIKNRLMSVASILTVTSCIFILAVSFCIAMNIDYLLQQLENSMGLSIILSEELTADDVNVLYDKILRMPEVKSVKYISSDEALRQFNETLGDETELMDALQNDNPLRRSFEIELHSNRDQAGVITYLETLAPEGVEKVRHAKEIIDLLIAVNNMVGIVSSVFIVTLSLISVIIIINTIKLTVNNRRYEIGIMKYVGATDWFIRWPFIIEGVLIGLIGSLIPICICGFGYGKAVQVINEYPLIGSLGSFLMAYDLFSVLMPVTLAGGIIIGSVGSVISMRKYLKV